MRLKIKIERLVLEVAVSTLLTKALWRHYNTGRVR